MTGSASESGSQPLERYLEALFARARPTTLIELRWRVPGGMRQRFVPASQRAVAAELITTLGQHTMFTSACCHVGGLPATAGLWSVMVEQCGSTSSTCTTSRAGDAGCCRRLSSCQAEGEVALGSPQPHDRPGGGSSR